MPAPVSDSIKYVTNFYVGLLVDIGKLHIYSTLYKLR